MTAVDPENHLHRAALDRLEALESIAAQAKRTAELARVADQEGIDGDPLRDAAETLAELGRLEADRCLALVAEAEE